MCSEPESFFRFIYRRTHRGSKKKSINSRKIILQFSSLFFRDLKTLHANLAIKFLFTQSQDFHLTIFHWGNVASCFRNGFSDEKKMQNLSLNDQLIPSFTSLRVPKKFCLARLIESFHVRLWNFARLTPTAILILFATKYFLCFRVSRFLSIYKSEDV
jgi:hypothetical protein